MACIECQQNNPCAPEPCVQEICTCPVLISSDCVNNFTADLECSNILKGQTLTETIIKLDAYICERFNSVENFFKLVNVGAGSQIYKGISILGEKEIRTLIDSNLINIVQGTNDITISVDETALNTFIEANQKTYSTTNIGTGAQVYKNTTVVGDNTQFNLRKIKSSNSSVTVTEGTDDIDLSVVVPDGSETKVTAGTNVDITGVGTTASPYIVSSIDTNTTYSAGTGLTLTGTVFSVENLQKEVITSYTLVDGDFEYTVFINNGATPVTITLSNTVTIPNFCVGFIQEGTGDVTFVGTGVTLTNPIGLKSRGQGYQTFIERKLATSTFYLLGNTKT